MSQVLACGARLSVIMAVVTRLALLSARLRLTHRCSGPGPQFGFWSCGSGSYAGRSAELKRQARFSTPSSTWATPAINATRHARATAAGMFTCWRNSLSGRKVPAAVLVGGRARVCCFVTVLGCRWAGVGHHGVCHSVGSAVGRLRLTRGCSGPGPQFGLRECGHEPYAGRSAEPSR